MAYRHGHVRGTKRVSRACATSGGVAHVTLLAWHQSSTCAAVTPSGCVGARVVTMDARLPSWPLVGVQ